MNDDLISTLMLRIIFKAQLEWMNMSLKNKINWTFFDYFFNYKSQVMNLIISNFSDDTETLEKNAS